MAQIFPSLISADVLNFAHTITTLEPFCDGFHIDVMDNNFVPNLTIGPDIVNAIGHLATKPLWIHLMVNNPQSILERLTIKEGSIVTFHCENHGNKEELIKKIKDRGFKAGLALNPNTPVHDLLTYGSIIDQALIMSVNPGFSGQSFMPAVEEKIAPLIAYKQSSDASFTIAMDGGIDQTNIASLHNKGVEQFGIASAIFNTPDPIETLKKLKNSV